MRRRNSSTPSGVPSRVARALVDRRPPWRTRELAGYSGASLGSTARMIAFLDREALVRRDAAGSVEDADWSGILWRWADDYDLTKRRRVTRALVPRGVDAIADGLRDSSTSYAVSGSLAARRVAPEAEARLGLLYAQDTEAVLAALRARASSGATNLLVIEPADDTPFVRSFDDQGVRYVAYSQAAVDLLAGPGRMPQEGDAPLEWIAANEDPGGNELLGDQHRGTPGAARRNGRAEATSRRPRAGRIAGDLPLHRPACRRTVSRQFGLTVMPRYAEDLIGRGRGAAAAEIVPMLRLRVGRDRAASPA